MLVKDLMTRDPITVVPSVGIKAAMTKLAFARITSMPVVDDERQLCGIVSEADLIQGVADDPRAHERPFTMRPVTPAHTVDDVYTRSPVAVGPMDDVTAVVDVMTAKGFKSLPVVDHAHRLVGIVSRSDVLRASPATTRSSPTTWSGSSRKWGTRGGAWRSPAVSSTSRVRKTRQSVRWPTH